MCRKMDVKHTLSSAHNPRSNGQVERKIQFIKDLIAKCGAVGFTEALLQYRATPLGPGLGSPAELVMNRTLRTRIPSIEDAGYLRAPMENRTDERHYHERVLENQNIIKSYHDKVCKESNKSYRPGDFVRYRDGPGEQWSKEGQVVSQVNSRSYELVNTQGNVIRRNNRLLQADRTANSLPVRRFHDQSHVYRPNRTSDPSHEITEPIDGPRPTPNPFPIPANPIPESRQTLSLFRP